MIKVNTFLLLVAICILPFAQSSQLVAQDDTDDLMDMSIDDLLNMEVSIASKVSQTQEEAPSVVSVISSQDIAMYGARDMTDVLRMVPGFEFGMDVSGLAGIFARGSWGHEGKVLLMIDGMTINDLAYGNFNFIGSLPVDMISRVEIIRGPGSAVYGGFAETATVNIITKTGKELNGAKISANAGALSKDLTYGGNISYGLKKDDMEFSTHIGYNSMPLSNEIYTDFNGNQMKQSKENSLRRWWHFIAKAKIKDFTMGYSRTSFNFYGQDWYKDIVKDVNGNSTSQYNNFSENILLGYSWSMLDDKLTIEPLVELTRGNPITTTVMPTLTKDGGLLQGFHRFQNASVEFFRNKYQVTGTYAEDTWNVLGGLGYIGDRAIGNSVTGRHGFQTSANPADTVNKADVKSIYGFLQGMVKLDPINITAGIRVEDTDFGSAVAPRVGVTYVYEKFNAKVLYGMAFRVPLIWQAYSRRWPPELGSELKPETTNSFETELGYKFTKHIKLTINGYYNIIEDKIVFAKGKYQNSLEKGANVGGEASLNARWENYGAYVNMSYCKPIDAKMSDISVVFDKAGDAQGLLGYPEMMANAGVFYKYKMFSFAPSMTFLGKRYSANPTQAELDAETTYSNQNYKENDALVMLNFAVSAVDVMDIFTFTLSAHNITGAEYTLIQSYSESHAPIATNDRQFVFRMSTAIK